MIRIFAKAASFSALGAKGQILNLINPSLGIKTSMDEGKPIESQNSKNSLSKQNSVIIVG